MIEIPAGSFMMGSPESEFGRDFDEFLHHVVIKNNIRVEFIKFVDGKSTTNIINKINNN